MVTGQKRGEAHVLCIEHAMSEVLHREDTPHVVCIERTISELFLEMRMILGAT